MKKVRYTIVLYIFHHRKVRLCSWRPRLTYAICHIKKKHRCYNYAELRKLLNSSICNLALFHTDFFKCLLLCIIDIVSCDVVSDSQLRFCEFNGTSSRRKESRYPSLLCHPRVHSDFRWMISYYKINIIRSFINYIKCHLTSLFLRLFRSSFWSSIGSLLNTSKKYLTWTDLPISSTSTPYTVVCINKDITLAST